jgi:hypothetical protein
MTGHAEIGLHLAPFLRQHQRQNKRRAEALRHPGKQPGALGRRIGRQRAAALGKQFLPALDVAVLDQRQLVEQLLPLGIALDRRKGAVQVRRVSFVAIVFVPRRVGLRRFRRRAARLSHHARFHRTSIAALVPLPVGAKPGRIMRAVTKNPG